MDIFGFREFCRANAPSGDTSLATLANHKVQGNVCDPDGTRVELMEDHTADGFSSPMSSAPLFEGIE